MSKSEDLMMNVGEKATWIGVFVNILLSFVKIIAGMIGNSAAMVADGVHSFSDLITDFVTLTSLRIAGVKPDKEHPFGHARAQVIGSLFVGLVVCFVGAGMLLTAAEMANSDELLSPTVLALWGAIISIFAKVFLFKYTDAVGRKINSDAVIANAKHQLSDALSSVAALIGIVGAMIGYPVADPIAASVVGLMICYAGMDILWGAVQGLMDVSASAEQLSLIHCRAMICEGVRGVHDLRTKRIGSEVYAELDIEVSDWISVSEAHNIAALVQSSLMQSFGWIKDVTVHVDIESTEKHYDSWTKNGGRKALESFLACQFASLNYIQQLGHVVIHFRDGRVTVEVNVVANSGKVNDAWIEIKALQSRLNESSLYDECCVKLCVS